MATRSKVRFKPFVGLSFCSQRKLTRNELLNEKYLAKLSKFCQGFAVSNYTGH